MLVLKRKHGEAVIINERIRVVVWETSSGGCKLAIDAPREDIIRREELPPEVETVIHETATALRLPR